MPMALWNQSKGIFRHSDNKLRFQRPAFLCCRDCMESKIYATALRDIERNACLPTALCIKCSIKLSPPDENCFGGEHRFLHWLSRHFQGNVCWLENSQQHPAENSPRHLNIIIGLFNKFFIRNFLLENTMTHSVIKPKITLFILRCKLLRNSIE